MYKFLGVFITAMLIGASAGACGPDEQYSWIEYRGTTMVTCFCSFGVVNCVGG